MDTLILYDEEGYIISTRKGIPNPKVPSGVPYLWVNVPEGQRINVIAGVDITKTPHTVELELIKKTEIETLKEVIADLTELVLLGGE